MAPVEWRPGCLFRLLCNKMDTLRFTKYAVQPFNLLSFLFPVSDYKSLLHSWSKNTCFGSKWLGRRGEALSSAAHLKSRLWWWVTHYRPFHHGPRCSHSGSYLSPASLLMERKAQERSCTGCHAPLHSWADMGLCGAVLQEFSCSLLSSSLHFPSSSTHVRFLSRTGQEQLDSPQGLHWVAGRQKGHLWVGARVDQRSWRSASNSNCFSQNWGQEKSRLFLIKPTTEKDPWYCSWIETI